MSNTGTDIINQLKDNLTNPYYVVLLAILGAATFLRFKYAFFDGMWVDEGHYARIALELSEHPFQYTKWGETITGIPPVYPYLMALSTYIFGKTEFAVRIVSPLVSVLGVGITYFLGKDMKNKEVGLLAAALLAVNPIYWFLSERILLGATLTVLYTATLAALYHGLEDKEYSKHALWAVGPLTALTLMTKQPAYTLGLIIPAYLIYKRRDDFRQLKDDFSLDLAWQKFDNLFIAMGLGALTLLPYSIRSMMVCGWPLCGLQRALSFASGGGGSVDSTVFSVQGSMYFITNLPSILTLPVVVLLGARVAHYLLDYIDADPDHLVKYAVVTGIGLGIGYAIKPALIPLVLISSMALLAKSDAEKLLWIWAGIGIGFMSIPTIKVPRYIVFTVPALVTLSAISAYSISGWLTKVFDKDGLKPWMILVLIAIPALFVSYSAGVQNAQMGGFPPIEDAGNWMAENTPEDAKIAATSHTQIMFYAHPRVAHMPPGENQSDLKEFIREEDVSYVVLDTYEKAQPSYTQLEIPPHRVPNDLRRQLANRQVSGQQVASQFGETPAYLEPLARFGKARVVPFREIVEPQVIVYRVNETALE